jgi:hypothetical protein
MIKCDYCGTSILFGGKRQGELRFCNATCARRGALLGVSRQLLQNVVDEAVIRVHQGLCPKCGGKGPVDVHVHHRVWSALVVTSWRSTPQISCRACGIQSQAEDALFCLALGWWGIPWGFIITPVQMIRNVVGMLRGPDPLKPSPRLETAVRMKIASTSVGRPQGGESSSA